MWTEQEERKRTLSSFRVPGTRPVPSLNTRERYYEAQFKDGVLNLSLGDDKQPARSLVDVSILMCLPFKPPSYLPPSLIPLKLLQRKFPLTISFTYGTVYESLLLSPHIPPSLSSPHQTPVRIYS